MAVKSLKQASSARNPGDGTREPALKGRSRRLFGEHVAALLKKRLLTFGRDKKMWAFVVLMPALFVLAGTLVLLSVETSDEPALLLTPTVRMVCSMVCVPVFLSVFSVSSFLYGFLC